ncbi:MAG: hypothetical protein LC130_28825 [Bryobacterales bacterium]|nr:hypothetical protein [Bryobacterales bacterium]
MSKSDEKKRIVVRFDEPVFNDLNTKRFNLGDLEWQEIGETLWMQWLSGTGTTADPHTIYPRNTSEEVEKNKEAPLSESAKTRYSLNFPPEHLDLHKKFETFLRTFPEGDPARSAVLTLLDLPKSRGIWEPDFENKTEVDRTETHRRTGQGEITPIEKGHRRSRKQISTGTRKDKE